MDKTYSTLLAMIENSDIVPAIHILDSASTEHTNPFLAGLSAELEEFYPFLYGHCSLAQHYDRYYSEIEGPKTGLRWHDVSDLPRYKAVAERLSGLAAGSRVLDYGCAEGSYLLGYARDFPHLYFVGVDIAEAEVAAVKENAQALRRLSGASLDNFEVHRGEHTDWSPWCGEGFDAVIMGELLEHVPTPWEVMAAMQGHCHENALIITTTPIGPWELKGCREQGAAQWPWRAHIWHLDDKAMYDMLGSLEGFEGTKLLGQGQDRGHIVTSYRYRATYYPSALSADEKFKDAAALRSPLALGIDFTPKTPPGIERGLLALSCLAVPPVAIRVPAGHDKDDQLGRALAKNPWVRPFSATSVSKREFEANMDAVITL